MELWMLLAILSYFCYAISTSIDKYFMNTGHEPVATNTFKMFFDGAILVVIGLLFFELQFSSQILFAGFVLGIIYAVSGIIYFNLLKLRDVQAVLPSIQSLKILLVFVGAAMFFSEPVNMLNILGLGLILAGIYAVLAEPGFKRPVIDKAIFLIIAGVALSIAYSLLAKLFLFDAQPISLAISMYFSSAVVLFIYILLWEKQRQAVDFKSARIVSAAFFAAVATLLLFSSLAIGFASKVFAIAGLQSVFVFIIALLLLKERFYWHRLLGTVAVFAGIFLVSI